MYLKKSRLVLLFAALAILAMVGFSSFSVRGTLSANAAQQTFSIYLPLIFKNSAFASSVPIFGAEMAQLSTAGGLDDMAAAKAAWTRRNALMWSAVEPTEGTRSWDAGLDQELQNASSKGMRVVLIVRSAPAWAQKVAGSACGPVAANKMSAFANFMHDAVTRYSASPYNVKYWEIWNEEDMVTIPGDNLFGCWGDSSDPYWGGGYYASLLRAVYPQIKAADSQAQVLSGGLLLDCDPRNPPAGKDCRSGNFLEGILRGGGGPYFDGVSFHTYDYYQGKLGQYLPSGWSGGWNGAGPVTITKVNFINQVLANYGVTGKYLMNTESALLCLDQYTPCDATFETSKAYYVVHAYAAAMSLNLRANIWYSALGWRSSGLLPPTLDAYRAFQFARSELGAPQYLGNVTSSDLGGASGVKGYKFDRGDRVVWVVWSQDGSTHTVNLASTPSRVWDALGNAVTPAASFAVGLNPRYIEW